MQILQHGLLHRETSPVSGKSSLASRNDITNERDQADSSVNCLCSKLCTPSVGHKESAKAQVVGHLSCEIMSVNGHSKDEQLMQLHNLTLQRSLLPPLGISVLACKKGKRGKLGGKWGRRGGSKESKEGSGSTRAEERDEEVQAGRKVQKSMKGGEERVRYTGRRKDGLKQIRKDETKSRTLRQT